MKTVVLDSTLSRDDNGYDGTYHGSSEDEHIHITSDAPAVTRIEAAGGNDSVKTSKGSIRILGGEDNDTIIVASATNRVTISGDEGNDLVSLSSSHKNCVILYKSGDGNDVVEGLKTSDTISISGGSYSSQTSGSNIILTVGDGKITLQGAADLSSVNIDGTLSGGSSTVTTGGGSSSVTTGGGNSTVTTGGGSSTVTMRGGNSTVTSSFAYVYSGGDEVISSYTSGEKIALGTPPTNMFFADGNFAMTSATGTLIIQNANDKIINFVDGSGNDYAKAYAATNPGVIDGSGLAGFEFIVGSSTGSDVIFAGNGGSNLWGGAGFDADALVGGDGTDVFIGGKYQGSDNFINASSADIVNLTDATLSDLVATASDGAGTVLLGFNTGNVISIQGNDVLSAAITFADGSALRFNNATQTWQGA